jgi:hypothetical protein
MKILMRTAAVALALACAAPVAALAQGADPAADTMFRATTFNLSAYGETRIAPDMATISLGVHDPEATAAQAMQANATRMAAVPPPCARRASPSQRHPDLGPEPLGAVPLRGQQAADPDRLPGVQPR